MFSLNSLLMKEKLLFVGNQRVMHFDENHQSILTIRCEFNRWPLLKSETDIFFVNDLLSRAAPMRATVSSFYFRVKILIYSNLDSLFVQMSLNWLVDIGSEFEIGEMDSEFQMNSNFGSQLKPNPNSIKKWSSNVSQLNITSNYEKKHYLKVEKNGSALCPKRKQELTVSGLLWDQSNSSLQSCQLMIFPHCNHIRFIVDWFNKLAGCTHKAM